MILSLLFLFSLKVMADENPSVVYKNNKAVSQFTDEKIVESKMGLEKEVVNHPKSAPLHYNLGFIHENAKEPEKAIKEYSSAATISDNQDLKFRAHFNAARVYGEQNNIPSALKHYQAALEIRPDSEEVKTNIELLFKGNGGGGNQSEQEQQSDKDKKNQQQQAQKPQPPQDQQQQQKKNQAPRPFKSEELSDQDVRRILDELKRQEEQIRAKMNNQKSKETPGGKDW